VLLKRFNLFTSNDANRSLFPLNCCRLTLSANSSLNGRIDRTFLQFPTNAVVREKESNKEDEQEGRLGTKKKRKK
jgi:hypothetical protein